MLEITLERFLVGGLRLAANKAASTARPIARGLVPPRLVVALRQHAGRHGERTEPVVRIGERVLKGQPLVAVDEGASRAGPPTAAGPRTAPAVHASSSGRVVAIEERLVPGGSGLLCAPCVIIETDGEDRAMPPASSPPAWPADREAQLRRIAEGGLAGLGGAVFPTAAKLAAAGGCRMLIVNGAECEPYISCDDMLMREAPEEVVGGARLLADLAGAPTCVIAIERDKPEAIRAVAAAARAAASAWADDRLRLAEVPTVYPAGGERQLVELLTGSQVPSGGLPSDLGFLCQNVGTAAALYRLAARAEPLVSRIVTVTGGGVADPRNLEVPIGTPIAWLVERCGGYREDVVRLIHGGSMMGYALPSDELPVTKATNCIVAARAAEVRSAGEAWPCIRCGECAAACPARLLPQQLLVAAGAADMGALATLGLRDCIECGCCDVACPSQIELTASFRAAKHAYAAHERRARLSAAAERRFERRERRREQEAARSRESQETLRRGVRGGEASGRDTVAAAVERARRRREDSR